MKIAGVVLIGVFLLVGIGVWLHHAYSSGVGMGSNVAAAVTLPIAATPGAPAVGTVSTGVANTSDLLTLHGTAIMDTSVRPAVPYIKYQDSSNRVATKQLIFADTRGCSPGAGDIPCVPSYSVTAPYPQLTNGESITVTGYMHENRFLITSMTSGS